MEVARFRCDRRKECPDSNGSRRRREGPAEFENFAAHGSVTRSESRTTENREGVVVVESSVVSDRLHTHDRWPCWENRCRSVDLFRDARTMPRGVSRHNTPPHCVVSTRGSPRRSAQKYCEKKKVASKHATRRFDSCPQEGTVCSPPEIDRREVFRRSPIRRLAGQGRATVKGETPRSPGFLADRLPHASPLDHRTKDDPTDAPLRIFRRFF